MNASGLAAAIQQGRDGCFLNVHVQPGAKRQRLCGLYGDAVKIAVQARAVDGRANDAVLAFVASALAIPDRQIRLVAGAKSRRKRLCIQCDADLVLQRLSAWLDDA